MKKQIDLLNSASDILNSLRSGILLTTKANDKVNSMTISWGSFGIEWGKPIFTVYVRENRFTKHQLDENPEFTINVPVGEFDKKILAVCGTKSGHNTDKIKELGLTLVDSENISVPAIKELPLTLECKVVYKQKQCKENITEENNKMHYPQDVDSSYHAANKDYHTMYFGEIVNAYIVLDDE